MIILGISAFYHDAAAALVWDGKVIAAAQEERFSRIKHDASFPMHASIYCLEQGGIRPSDLDAVAFYDKPWLKFERILETHYCFAPRSLKSFLVAMPSWISDKLFLKKTIRNEIEKLGDCKDLKILFPEHHLSHAASAFFCSPFSQSAILTIDGVGEWATTSLGQGEGNHINLLKELHFPHSVGLLYSAFTQFLGFRVNDGEYKVMGLAPYGASQSKQVQHFIDLIFSKLVSLKSDGSIALNQEYFRYCQGMTMIAKSQWISLFEIQPRLADQPIEQVHCNLAMAIQIVLEDILHKMTSEVKRLTDMENLCIAGGVALNCVANQKILGGNLFRDVFVQPAAGDAGGALGAALATHHIYFDRDRLISERTFNPYLGPGFSDQDIKIMNRRLHAVFKRYDSLDDLVDFIAHKIASGKIVGWFQGRMEFGPRALGNRSILADPRDPKMQSRINLKVKKRESFRPFAPSVLKEDGPLFFEVDRDMPYMLFTNRVRNRIETTECNSDEEDLSARLQRVRSDLPAVTHVDYSARVQTVDKNFNKIFWKLLKAFKNMTGCGVLLNTSFNRKDEPIVCKPIDAYHCFIDCDIDYLVINKFVYCKDDQPK